MELFKAFKVLVLEVCSQIASLFIVLHRVFCVR